MYRAIASRLSYANVMATASMFVALGGVGYAAIKLPANSVGSRQIVNGAITGADIKNGSLTGADVKNGSLTPADTCTAAEQAKANCAASTCETKACTGPKGDAGSPGVAGPKGDQGSVGPTDSVIAASNGGDNGSWLFDQTIPSAVVWPDYAAATITTPRSGRLLLSLTTHDRWGILCPNGSAGLAGVVLDGQPVPQSASPGPYFTDKDFVTRVAVTGVVAAGAHTVNLASSCPNGSIVSVSAYPTFTVTATLIGS